MKYPSRCAYFNPHSPCGERLPACCQVKRKCLISIHTPLAGSDAPAKGTKVRCGKFQSTLPLRGATIATDRCHCSRKYFNPHSPCGERPAETIRRQAIALQFQSTLPLRGATSLRSGRPSPNYFNPHSPCGERPTPPCTASMTSNFNPHSPCGERPRRSSGVRRSAWISIHTPLAGSDVPHAHGGKDTVPFQSTLPLRGATSTPRGSNWETKYFNPHSPCGERQTARKRWNIKEKFQSTLPLRGATAEMRHF